MTNLNIAKLYLATNTTATAAQIDAAITDGSAATAVTALTGTTLLNAIYQAAFGRDADAEGIAYWTSVSLTGDALVSAIMAGAAKYPTTGALAATAASDTTIVAAKATAEAAAGTTAIGTAVVALVSVVDSATATVAVETIDNAEYTAALATYTAAVTTAAASKAAADAAALTVSSVALATASSTAAATAKTDADAVVTAAAAVVAVAADTVSAADDVTSAAAATTAATAQTAAAALVTTAAAAVTTATAAAAAAAATGTTFTMTTSNDIFSGTDKSDTFTGLQDTVTPANDTYENADVFVDASTVDNDTMTITANGSVTNTPTISGIENVLFNVSSFSATTVDATDVSNGTVTADTVQVAGSTAITINNIAGQSGANAAAGDAVRTFTVDLASGGATVNANAATAINVSDIDSDGVTITSAITGTATTPTAISIEDDNNGDADDVATISAAGVVTLDLDATADDTVEILNLSGNGAAVTYDIASATTAANTVETVTLTGDQDVTIIIAEAAIDGEVLVDNTTAGTTKVQIDVAGASDLDQIAADVIDIEVDNVGAAYTVATGAKVQYSSDQTAASSITAAAATAATNTLTIDFNDDDDATIQAANGTANVISLTATTVTNFEDVNLIATDAIAVTTSYNFGTGADVFISGAGDVGMGVRGTLVAITADSVDASDLTGVLSISMGTTVDSVIGGSGNDVIHTQSDADVTIDGGDGIDTVEFANNIDLSDNTISLSNVEVIELADNALNTLNVKSSLLSGETYIVTDAVDNATETSLTVTLDATSADLSTLSVDDTNITVTIDLTGVNTVTSNFSGTNADDQLANVSTGAITVDAKGGDDIITTGTGVDSITGGEGADTITSDVGADTIDLTETTAEIDIVVTTVTADAAYSAAGSDTIIGFDAGLAADNADNLDIDLGSAEALVTNMVLAGNSTTAAAAGDLLVTNAGVTANVTAAYDVGDAPTATWLNVTGTYAASTDLETALEVGGDRALTANGAGTADDGFLVTYSDGTDSYLAIVASAAGAGDNTTYAASDLTVTNIVTFAGITDVSTFTADSFDIVA